MRPFRWGAVRTIYTNSVELAEESRFSCVYSFTPARINRRFLLFCDSVGLPVRASVWRPLFYNLNFYTTKVNHDTQVFLPGHCQFCSDVPRPGLSRRWQRGTPGNVSQLPRAAKSCGCTPSRNEYPQFSLRTWRQTRSQRTGYKCKMRLFQFPVFSFHVKLGD